MQLRYRNPPDSTRSRPRWPYPRPFTLHSARRYRPGWSIQEPHRVKHTHPARLVEVGRRAYTVTGPFNPRTTLHKPSHFPSPFEVAKRGEYVFLAGVGRRKIGGRATYREGGRRVELRIYLPERRLRPDNLQAIQDELARRLGLTLACTGYEKIWDSDPILGRLPDEMRGARPATPFSLYEFLVICTVLQNTTVRRTVQMASTLAHNLGRAYQFPEGPLLHGFWKPADLVKFGESSLRELRLGYRAKNLVRFSEQFRADPGLEAELLGLRDNPDSLRARVKTIYGVGPASAAYIMFEWFKCIDEFHYLSPWERRILSKLLFDRSDTPASDIVQFCRDRWTPYTMLAVHAVFEAIFWRRVQGQGPDWLNELIRL